MKTILFAIVILCISCVSITAQSQKSRSFAHTVKDNLIEYKIPIETEGTYSVVLLTPSGETLSWPVKDEKYSKGQSLDLTVNSKYWSSGTYRLQLLRDDRSIEMYAVHISLSERERAKIE